MKNLIVVNNRANWNIHIDGVEVVSAKEYLTEPEYSRIKNVRVFNLCRSYSYQSAGYYVSLLAEARSHRVFPSITTIQDFLSRSILKVISEDLEENIQKSLSKISSEEFVLSIYFGRNLARQYDRLSREIYNLFPCPLLRARFVRSKKWVLKTLSPIPLNEIPDSHRPYVLDFAVKYFSRKKFVKPRLRYSFYDLAILVDPEEDCPPSDPVAIKKFIEAAEEVGFNVELITREDYGRIAEFDALFIRTTTKVNHYTYRFSRRAHAEGLAVVDDPLSILRCSNKVYLAESLSKARLPIPKTVILNSDTFKDPVCGVKFPCILKQPDSSFSQGVIKAENQQELESVLTRLFEISDLVVMQEFIPTEFDWRIGVLNNRVLYACKYFMARGHWQICDWSKQGDSIYGMAKAYKISEVPQEVIKAALKASACVGSGFYGVDIKQRDGRVYVIEVNDNPSVESRIEDRVVKGKLYLNVMRYLMQKIRSKERDGRTYI